MYYLVYLIPTTILKSDLHHRSKPSIHHIIYHLHRPLDWMTRSALLFPSANMIPSTSPIFSPPLSRSLTRRWAQFNPRWKRRLTSPFPRSPVTSRFFNLTRCRTSVTPTLQLPYPNRVHSTPSPDQGVPPMGTSASKNSDSSHGGRDGQLYVSLKMENFNIRGDLIPHVYGSAPITGSWDSAKAVRSTTLPRLFPISLYLTLLDVR